MRREVKEKDRGVRGSSRDYCEEGVIATEREGRICSQGSLAPQELIIVPFGVVLTQQSGDGLFVLEFNGRTHYCSGFFLLLIRLGL